MVTYGIRGIHAHYHVDVWLIVCSMADNELESLGPQWGGGGGVLFVTTHIPHRECSGEILGLYVGSRKLNYNLG